MIQSNRSHNDLVPEEEHLSFVGVEIRTESKELDGVPSTKTIEFTKCFHREWLAGTALSVRKLQMRAKLTPRYGVPAVAQVIVIHSVLRENF